MIARQIEKSPRIRGISFVWVLILLTLAALITTVSLIASVAYFRSKSALQVIESDHYRLAVTEVATELHQVLRPEASIVREFQVLLQRNLLSSEDFSQLGAIFAERLRSPDCLTGLSFAAENSGKTVEVERTADGRMILKLIDSRTKPEQQTEYLIFPDGRIGPPQISKSKILDPFKRAWYTNAVGASGKVIWLPPYQFIDNQYGITAACSVFYQDTKQLMGVLAADFSLQAIHRALATLFTKHHRLLFLTMEDFPLAESSTFDPSLTKDLQRHCLQQNLPRLDARPRETAVGSFKWEGVQYVGALTGFLLGDEVRCHVGFVAPESDFLNVAKKNIFFAMEIGGCAFLVAIIVAVAVSMKLGRPLSQISRDLNEVAQFKIQPASFTASPLYEVRALGDATQHMKQGIQSFARYVPDYVVRKLLRENKEANLEAVPREITVFVSDLEGFTGMAENLTANQLVQQLDEYFELVIPTLEKQFEGMVDKLLGDGILASFNTLEEQSNHAENACNAALSIIKSLEDGSKKRGEAGLPPLKARIGLATGKALVGNFGTENRFSFSAAGEPVILATRLERLSKQYGTLCLATGETHLATEKKFEWRLLTEKCFFDHPVQIFELLGRSGEVEEGILEARDLFEEANKKFATGNFQKALELLRKSIKLRPKDLAAIKLWKLIYSAMRIK